MKQRRQIIVWYDDFGNPIMNELMQQQMDMQMYYQQQQYQQQLYQQQCQKVTKRDIVEYIKRIYNTENVVMVDEMETRNARHICPQGKVINILPVYAQLVQLPTGEYINVNVVYCRSCGKLIIDKNSLEML